MTGGKERKKVFSSAWRNRPIIKNESAVFCLKFQESHKCRNWGNCFYHNFIIIRPPNGSNTPRHLATCFIFTSKMSEQKLECQRRWRTGDVFELKHLWVRLFLEELELPSFQVRKQNLRSLWRWQPIRSNEPVARGSILSSRPSMEPWAVELKSPTLVELLEKCSWLLVVS